MVTLDPETGDVRCFQPSAGRRRQPRSSSKLSSLGQACPCARILGALQRDGRGLLQAGAALTGVDEVGSNATKPLWQLNEALQGHLIERETFGNGASTVYRYNAERRWLKGIQTTFGTSIVQSLEYTHLNNGRLDVRTMLTESREHTYDNLNRLRSTTDTFLGGSTRTSGYGYDASGNIIGRGDTVLTYLAGKPHFVDTVAGNTYHYDLNGNVDQRSGIDIPGGAQSFDYTPFDLPRAIHTGTGASAKTTQLEYTADQTRAVRRDADTTRFLVGGGLYERLVTTTTRQILEERFALYVGSRQLGEIVRKDDADQTLFFHTDHLGSVETISSESHASFKQAFDPFGKPIDPPNPAITRAGFTGHEHDDDLGLIDMKGRIYDPLAARFTSADPVMQAPFWSQGLNRYSYVFNDPINHTDPTGFYSDLDEWNSRSQSAAAMGGYSALLGIGTGGLSGFGAAASAFNLGQSGLAGGLGGAKPGGTFNVRAPTAAPTSAPSAQQSMHASGQVGSEQLNLDLPAQEDQRLARLAVCGSEFHQAHPDLACVP